MKTYTATLYIQNSDQHFIFYSFVDGNKEVRVAHVLIDKGFYDRIKKGELTPDFSGKVDNLKIKHTRTDGHYYHGTWTESEPTS